MQVAKSSSRDKFFESYIPFLSAILVNFAILFSMLLVIALFPRNSSLPLQLDNSPGNFPIGAVTAVFTPDTQVFLDFASWQSWYVQTAANFAVFLALFLILNWNLKKRERGIRFLYYSLVFLTLPIIANVLNLVLAGQSDVGPSGAYYTSNGLVVGFGLVNLWVGDVSGGLRKMLVRKWVAVLFILNALVGTFSLMLSFVDPVDFFSEVAGSYTVGYGIHIFCFYGAIGFSLVFGYWRRASLIVPQVPS